MKATSFIKSLEHHSDCSLITLWQLGDEAAFDVLYKRYVLKLVEYIAQKTGSAEIASELTQDVFLDLHVQKNDLSDIENLKAYLFAIAKNKVFNYYRHQLIRQKYRQHILMSGEPLVNDLKEMMENKELVQIIHKQIEQLPPKCREVFKLSRQENLSYKLIAQRLNISENTVDQHIQKALRIFRSIIENYNCQKSI